MFTPKIGEDFHFDKQHIFQMGWFNQPPNQIIMVETGAFLQELAHLLSLGFAPCDWAGALTLPHGTLGAFHTQTEDKAKV